MTWGMCRISAFALSEISLLAWAAAKTAKPLQHRELLFQELRRHSAYRGERATQRWAGVQSAEYTDQLGEVSCNFTVPQKTFELEPGQAHYIYCDLHYNDWPDGSWAQFVPQLMRGTVLDANSANYTPLDHHLGEWHLQAQYVWGGGGAAVSAFVGEKIQVKEGDHVAISIAPDGPHGSWVLRAAAGARESRLVVQTPFMGTNPRYQQPYGSMDVPDEYRRWVLGDLHEAWNLDEPKYYPLRMDWTVQYCSTAKPCQIGSLFVNEKVMSHCVDHGSGTECADDVMTTVPEVNKSGVCKFHVDRTAGAFVV